MADATCWLCQRPIRDRGSGAKYCSDSHAREAGRLRWEYRGRQNVKRVSSCVRCGWTFANNGSRARRFCSTRCADPDLAPVNSVRIRFGCDKCGRRGVYHGRGVQLCDGCRRPHPKASATRPPVECPQCHKCFPDRRGAVRARFCSYDCNWAWRRDNPIHGPHRKGLRPVRDPCRFCESKPRRSGGKYCSDVCQQYGTRKVPCSHRIYPIACLECGRSFIGRNANAKYCSKAHAEKAARRNRRPQRRAAKKGRRLLRSVGENFTLREIAVRDGWRCHLCGKRVPDRAYRARDLDPTLDHLVPVSQHGEHTRLNVALAHNRCNWERKVGGEVQLRLVG